MSVNFAGARSVDDRRRRRISQTTDLQAAQPKTARGNQRGLLPRSMVTSPEFMPESPVHALIPKTRWKFWTILGTFFLSWVIGASYGICYELIPKMNDLGISRIFNLLNGTFWSCWTISCLMISAQLSWVVYWYRSHGSEDFQGHYKTWLWTAIACTLVAFLLSTETGYIISEAFSRKVHLANKQMAGMIWLAGLFAVGYELTRRIDQELGECRSAYVFLVSFVTTALVGAWIVLTKETTYFELKNHAWTTLSHSLISFLLMATIYCFAHRTLYITAEAASRRESPLFKFLIHLPLLIWVTSRRTVYWVMGLFARNTVESEDEGSSKKKKSTRKPVAAKTRKPAGTTKKRKLKETIEEEESEEYAEEPGYDSDESQEESSEEDYNEENETPENSNDKFDEEAWLRAELEREEQLKKQAELERQQQKNNSAKTKFRIDPPPTQQGKAHLDKYSNYQEQEEQEEYQPKSQKQKNNESWQDESQNDEDSDNYSGGNYDPEMFKGLSKREKRKLKQQLRDQERQQGNR